MDAGSADGSQRVVQLSPEADLDLSEIHLYTALRFGLEQADRYVDFLAQECQRLCEFPHLGPTVANRPHLRIFHARWPGGRAGHRIVYEPTAEGIYVVRFLHTSRQSSGPLPSD